MTRTIVALSLLALSACVYGPVGLVRPANGPEAEAREAAISAWQSSDLETVGAECEQDVTRMRVAVARTHREMYTLTGYCGPSTEETRGTGYEGQLRCNWGRAAASYRRARDGGAWPFALAHPWYPLIVVWHGVDSARAMRHEAIHWLQQCTGRGHNPWDPHGDESVWCADGCPGRFRSGQQ